MLSAWPAVAEPKPPADAPKIEAEGAPSPKPTTPASAVPVAAPASQPPGPEPLRSAEPALRSMAGDKPAPKPAPVPPPVQLSQDRRPTFQPETYVATLRAAEAHRALVEAGGWPQTPGDAKLKLGDRGPAVAVLKKRLAASDDLPLADAGGDAFDAKTMAAVKRFQARHGLPETGLVATRTLAALNVPAEIRLRQLTGSAKRIAESRFPFGERHVIVNIPAASVEAVERGEVVRRYVAVVGKKERASPTIEARIQSVNFNPTWTLPVSIVKKDILPKARQDPGLLAKMKIRVFDGYNREVDPATLDWAGEKAAQYTFRQDAGAANSLGQVRIDMPNKLAVYMHDTPTKRLFARDDRFHSSGCVRVANVREFAEWLLQGAHEKDAAGAPLPWTLAEIDAAIAAGARRDVRLARHVPVAWVYLTGYATPDGVTHFRDDVYGLDKPDAAPVPPAPDDLVTSALPKRG